METDLATMLQEASGRVACLAISADRSGERELCSLNPTMVFPAASLAKLPILLTLALELDRPASPYSWSTRLAIPDAARVPGDGVLADLSPDLRPTIQDLAHLMIAISDNSAANVLLDLVGMETTNQTMSRLGLGQTRLERRFMDFAARQAGRDNWTTATDMALLFSQLLNGRIPERVRLINMLLRQNACHILPAYWGDSALFAHKTGGLEGVMHDAGILFHALDSPEALIIVALTADQPDIPQTNLILARAGQMLRQQWLAR